MGTPITLNQEYLLEIAKYATISLAIIAVSVTTVASIAFYRSEGNQAESFSLLIQRAGALQLVTVSIIVVAACFLTIIGKITSEGVVSILSGIAGYVLGGLGSKTNQSASDRTSSNQNDSSQKTT